MLGQIIAFIFGAIVGSFLNVCIHRMPLGESVVWPGSHCPHCKKCIPAYDNIPFIGYILLRGRCRFCRKRIPLRYPLVELLTALLFVLSFRHFRMTYDLFICNLFLCGLIIAAFVDIKHRIIPDEVSVGGAIAGFILVGIKGVSLSPLSFSYKPALSSLTGAAAGAGVIFLTGFLFDLVYFKLLKRPPIQGETESMGLGDVKLLAMVGAFLGWEKALLTFLAAPFLGLIVGLPRLILKKDHTIPYGPFLAAGAVLSLFWADKILRLFLWRSPF
jgi:leader peptidase (prepilin peptidase)/N-methyltransferase